MMKFGSPIYIGPREDVATADQRLWDTVAELKLENTEFRREQIYKDEECVNIIDGIRARGLVDIKFLVLYGLRK